MQPATREVRVSPGASFCADACGDLQRDGPCYPSSAASILQTTLNSSGWIWRRARFTSWTQVRRDVAKDNLSSGIHLNEAGPISGLHHHPPTASRVRCHNPRSREGWRHRQIAHKRCCGWGGTGRAFRRICRACSAPRCRQIDLACPRSRRRTRLRPSSGRDPCWAEAPLRRRSCRSAFAFLPCELYQSTLAKAEIVLPGIFASDIRTPRLFS